MYTLDYLPFVQKNEEPTAVYKCTAILLSDSSRQKQLDVQTLKGGSSLFFSLPRFDISIIKVAQHP